MSTVQLTFRFTESQFESSLELFPYFTSFGEESAPPSSLVENSDKIAAAVFTPDCSTADLPVSNGQMHLWSEGTP